MSIENATPRPWTRRQEDLRGGRFWVVDRPGTLEPIDLHEDDNGEADSELIVRAVNAHEALLDAIEELLDYRGGADSPFEDEYVMERVEAALKLARGES